MPATLHEMVDILRKMDPETLQEMGYQLARSHVRVCELTSKLGDCAHISADEIRDRVDRLTVEQLAALLAPTAWMASDLHERVGG